MLMLCASSFVFGILVMNIYAPTEHQLLIIGICVSAVGWLSGFVYRALYVANSDGIIKFFAQKIDEIKVILMEIVSLLRQIIERLK